jgi:hypothetical protein
LNDEVKILVAKYNESLQSARLEMGLMYEVELESRYEYDLPDERTDFGDIHVGKLSGGWKPLMQANEHFSSIKTLKQWYAKNKNKYVFINEYDEFISFEEYLIRINEWNQDPENDWHDFAKNVDGFDWVWGEFS